MTISVVIRSLNSASTLTKTLDSLIQQTRQVDEIILVDSGSEDNTCEIASSYGCKIISYPTDIPFNYSRALNMGIAAAIGELILIISSHIVFQNNNNLQFMLEILQRESKICVVSTYSKHEVHNSMQIQENLEYRTIFNTNFYGFAMTNFCSLFLRKHWIEKPFNEAMPSAEDQEWAKYFMDKHDYGTAVIYKPRIEYLNPYFNAYKVCRDMIVIGRFVHPYALTFKYIIRRVSLRILRCIFTLNFRRLHIDIKFIYFVIKEKLGRGEVFHSDYHNRKL
ncbi:MAG: glycosyltransferase family 2 protein [Saprospiraceae bacterium]